MNVHVATKLAKIDIGRALSILELCPDLDVDEQLKLSTLEGETQLNEIVSALLAMNEDDQGVIDALDAQIDDRTARKARFKRRIDTRKNAIVSLLDTAHLTKLPLPEATVTLRTLQPRIRVTDPDLLPDAFTIPVTTRKPDTEAIEAAVEKGAVIPGVVMTNGGTSLSVRRK